LVTDYWTRTDLEAPAAWIRTLPAGSSRDKALGAYVEGVARTDGAAAIPWAELIGNERDRHRALEVAAHAYLRRDERSARAWIEGSELKEEVRRQLLAPK
jgi:hypothetical protein